MADTEMTGVVTPRLLKQKVRRLADNDGRTLSAYVVRILEAHVAQAERSVLAGLIDRDA